MIKQITIRFLSILSFFWKIPPFWLRKRLLFAFFILESRGKSKSDSLRRLFALEDYLDLAINERALALGNGEHPKHYLMGYHSFFIEHLSDCKRIIDLGCGYGAVSRSIALAYPDSTVLGIDNNDERFNQALASRNPVNLSFQLIDIAEFQTKEPFDGVVLSNVLEHIQDRVTFLKKVMMKTQARKLLIRVPNFERHWSIPLRRNLNVNYFQDSDHKIEHSVKEFLEEIKEADLQTEGITTLWGEIWAVCMPASNND